MLECLGLGQWESLRSEGLQPPSSIILMRLYMHMLCLIPAPFPTANLFVGRPRFMSEL